MRYISSQVIKYIKTYAAILQTQFVYLFFKIINENEKIKQMNDQV